MRLRISNLFILLTIISTVQFASAQLRQVRPSQKASVMQTVGVTDVSITYSRPAVKGRPIFADATTAMEARARGQQGTLDNQNERVKGEPIVPYGHIWRSGANEATLFVVTDDVLINGQALAAGKYSLHTIPGKDEWTIIFNKDDGQWGSFSYDAAKDALRVKTKPQWAADNQELLEYSIDPITENSATVNIRWEKARVPFTISVDVQKTYVLHARDAVAAAKSDDFRTPFQAANTAKLLKADNDANKWFEQALKAADESIKAKETFQNLSAKANILMALGRKDDAVAAADKAIERGKADNADTAAFEKRFADIKAGKM